MIIKDLTLPNGSTATCHVVVNVILKHPFAFARVTVQSYATEAAFLAGAPYMMTNDHSMPLDNMALGGVLDAVEDWLLTTVMAGGAKAADMSGTIESRRDLAWERIKRARDAAEAADFEYDGHVYQANKLNVAGAALAAKIASDMGATPTFRFTLSNDTPIDLTAEQMMNVGLALTAKIEAVHERGRNKRASVYSATTQAQLDAITWFSEE